MNLKSKSRLVHEAMTSAAPAFTGLCAMLLATGLAAAQEAPEDAGDDPGFKVIVHADNPNTEMAAHIVAKMFRKKLKRWEHGVDVRPVDLEPASPIRRAFSRGVHKKSVTAIQSFWQRMIFSGRDEPPEAKETEEEVLTFVGAEPGAIGYVSEGEALGDSVKQLEITP